MLAVGLDQRAGDCQAQRAGLPRLPAARPRCAFTSNAPRVSVAVNDCWMCCTSDGRGK